MNTYIYECEIAGLRMQYRLPQQIVLTDNALPFMRAAGSTSDTEYDLIVDFSEAETLPPISDDAYQVVDRFYSRMKEDLCAHFQNWHLLSPGRPMFAYVLWEDARHIKVTYKPKQRELFSYANKVLDITGMETVLLVNGGFILHSSFVRYKDRAILFTAPSGTGKSTQADLWHSFLGARIINGDRAGIMRRDGKWYAYGLPYAGTSGIYQNEYAEIGMVICLSQAKGNYIRRTDHFESSMKLYPEILMHHWDPGYMNAAMDLLDWFVKEVPVYHLMCEPDYGAVEKVLEEFETQDFNKEIV